ncbi:predicted protein [Pyrenophora tritici-repentis Pt-1C-BFP]|uniref:Uncharacterized protein n=1 Tax=Pyrenophora tritici-repentis (strain Pt-1C-BFP) TaxID=426418 RepID=B2VUM9_PYRTR|nr:uncharacterized protein PTRG_02133 [Pyrenophora tritici-repentis Pt-1C-BFP]EDU41571.1 predicted protein [Pyrenophora tritici-repentis Pt-1C-BFP]
MSKHDFDLDLHDTAEVTTETAMRTIDQPTGSPPLAIEHWHNAIEAGAEQADKDVTVEPRAGRLPDG